mmetsp:Transcript_57175/g.133730  ORF Transcript_57175/g.133730 Transcript_57175/m.133730 type:complete len:226 (+) Transcript_57175:1750-2427(+)
MTVRCCWPTILGTWTISTCSCWMGMSTICSTATCFCLVAVITFGTWTISSWTIGTGTSTTSSTGWLTILSLGMMTGFSTMGCPGSGPGRAGAGSKKTGGATTTKMGGACTTCDTIGCATGLVCVGTGAGAWVGSAGRGAAAALLIAGAVAGAGAGAGMGWAIGGWAGRAAPGPGKSTSWPSSATCLNLFTTCTSGISCSVMTSWIVGTSTMCWVSSPGTSFSSTT